MLDSSTGDYFSRYRYLSSNTASQEIVCCAPSAYMLLTDMRLAIVSAGQAGFVANMADIAPGSAGQMFGLCGTFASLAGIIATSSVGLIVERTGNDMAPWMYVIKPG